MGYFLSKQKFNGWEVIKAGREEKRDVFISENK